MSEDSRPLLLNFLSQCYVDLKRRLTRIVGNDDLAGDALQDTWLRLQRLEDNDPIQNPQAFLLRMATHIAVDITRSRSRALPRSEVDALLDLPDVAPGPAQTVEGRAEMDMLLQIMQRLPARRRQILILVRWEGMPQKEVAEQLGVSVRTVEHELQHAHEFCAVRMAAAQKNIKKRGD